MSEYSESRVKELKEERKNTDVETFTRRKPHDALARENIKLMREVCSLKARIDELMKQKRQLLEMLRKV
jgi:FtsZ-binding cell division protein ZapB